MRKIDLKNYKWKAPSGPEQEVDARGNLIVILFNRQLGLTGREVYRRDKIAKLIESCKESFILLEQKDYEIVKDSFDRLKGLGQSERELVRRIYEAEVIEKKPKESKGGE